jgi:hypothetical protein
MGHLKSMDARPRDTFRFLSRVSSFVGYWVLGGRGTAELAGLGLVSAKQIAHR